MVLELPQDLTDLRGELDDFIEREIRLLEQQDDNVRFFDHRRENARTDWDAGGLPTQERENLLRGRTGSTEEIQMRRIAGYLFGFMKQDAPKGVRD
ncbi:hypothetical protein CLV47_101330 [Antricoccus suffuscus]|uniref:Uncharacterized protein n=1 Tax=Antricoccus suffuscus TaxID=1629062 RepID=A0A2T1A6G9_9ACTN|nr:hypothetical protein [Antricoccus suffuscus]PRZ44205.1 hypothetical protein CLV47_101330 [Antricoccus suffuscus]